MKDYLYIFDDDNEKAAEAAYEVENNSLGNWDEEAKAELAQSGIVVAEVNVKNIELRLDDYFDIEQTIKKIASENNVTNVREVKISLFKDKGVIKFKTAEDYFYAKETVNDVVIVMDFYDDKMDYELYFPQYNMDWDYENRDDLPPISDQVLRITELSNVAKKAFEDAKLIAEQLPEEMDVQEKIVHIFKAIEKKRNNGEYSFAENDVQVNRGPYANR